MVCSVVMPGSFHISLHINMGVMQMPMQVRQSSSSIECSETPARLSPGPLSPLMRLT